MTVLHELRKLHIKIHISLVQNLILHENHVQFISYIIIYLHYNSDLLARLRNVFIFKREQKRNQIKILDCFTQKCLCKTIIIF
jgi:hypothetical protein